MGDKLKKFKPRNVIAASMNLSRKGGKMKDKREKRNKNQPSYEYDDYQDTRPSCNDVEDYYGEDY